MPLPFLTLAIPVIHSSGAWIASTAAGGYITGTLSSTWIGAFIAGNSGILSGLGLVSAAGVFGSSGVLAGLGSSAAAGLGSAMTTVGLGGLATKLGLAPALFLGLTPTGWAIVGASTVTSGTIAVLLSRRTMKNINAERIKGGLEEISALELFSEVIGYERKAIEEIVEALSNNPDFDVQFIDDRKKVLIDGYSYPVKSLRYLVKEDGSESLILFKRIGRNKTVLMIVGPHLIEGPAV